MSETYFEGQVARVIRNEILVNSGVLALVLLLAAGIFSGFISLDQHYG